MTIGDVALVSTVAAWLLSVALPLVFPGMRIDATASLILMALAGALVVFRQRQEDVREDG
jgi:hypothetical protein